jgi:biopolymer transport protein ExbD
VKNMGVKLEMTPMIDVTFQLIAFFLFVLNFSKDALDERIRLPVADQAKPTEATSEEPLFLNLDREGYLLVFGQRWHVSEQVQEVRAYLRREAAYTRLEMEVAAREDPSSRAAKDLKKNRLSALVVLRADGEAPYAVVRQLIELCQQAGYYRFALRAKERED